MRYYFYFELELSSGSFYNSIKYLCFTFGITTAMIGETCKFNWRFSIELTYFEGQTHRIYIFLTIATFKSSLLLVWFN